MPDNPIELLRMLCGVWFLPHVIGKALNIERASGTFEKVGLKPGRFFLLFTIGLELAAAAGLVSGRYTAVAAGLAVIVLLGASYAVLRINGWNWRWQKQGPEYMLLWAAACVLTTLGS